MPRTAKSQSSLVLVILTSGAGKSGAHPTKWTRTPVAQLRYRVGTGQWSLREPTATGWTAYRGDRGPTKTIGPQLDELDADPTGIFWG